MTETPAATSNLQTRIKSAAIFAPIVLIILFFGGGGFTLMMAAASAIGVYEWARMITKDNAAAPKALIHLSAAVGGIGALAAGMVSNPVTALWFIFALCFLVFSYNYSKSGGSVRLLIGGIVYIAFSCGVMIWIRNGTENGLYHMLTLLCIVWGSDIAAYFTGKTLGGPKLAPTISPKKTWSGFFGSSIGAGLIAAVLAIPAFVSYLNVATLGGMGMIGYFVMGFILAMFGQAGDLLISIFKRHFDVKDTGALIPGHGGILDRIDALLLVALLFGALAFVLA
jgi:phosphatidate cytidylyltransferase